MVTLVEASGGTPDNQCKHKRPDTDVDSGHTQGFVHSVRWYKHISLCIRSMHALHTIIQFGLHFSAYVRSPEGEMVHGICSTCPFQVNKNASSSYLNIMDVR